MYDKIYHYCRGAKCMKKKRLNRDGWGFQYFLYFQLRIDMKEFHGLACVIKIVEGQGKR